MNEIIINELSGELNIKTKQIEAVLKLLEEGNQMNNTWRSERTSRSFI